MSLERPLRKPTLRAALDRLIPADDGVGAIEAGVEEYVLAELDAGGIADRALLTGGLDGLDRLASVRLNASFAELASSDQDALLRDVEHGNELSGWPDSTDAVAFFDALVELAHEGFYAGPDSGGGAAAWSMLGYSSRVPGRA